MPQFMTDEENPSTPSAAHLAMRGPVATVRALRETETMRSAGAALLPQYSREKDTSYQTRLARAVLFPGFNRVRRNLASKPFTRQVTVQGAPVEVSTLFDNIDKQGTSLTDFCRAVFREGLGVGLTNILVEYPAVQEGLTAQQLREREVRPYWVHVPVDRIISAVATIEDGVELLEHLRVHTVDTQRVGYAERVRERIKEWNRVLVQEEDGTVRFAVTVQTWELDPEANNRDKWDLVETPREIDIDVIPLVTFYVERLDHMVATTPMRPVSDLNVEHWQSSSDQRNILTVARFPMLAGSGVDEKGQDVEVGPLKTLTTTQPEGRWYYVEHSGKAIDAGFRDCDRLKEEMATVGAEVLVKRGEVTATEKVIDEAETRSDLQAMCGTFEVALNQALLLTARWLDLDEGGKASVNKKFGVVNESTWQNLRQMRSDGDLSLKTYFELLVQAGLLPHDFGVDQEVGRVEAEREAAADLFGASPRAEPDDAPNDLNPAARGGNGPPPDEGGVTRAA